MGKIKKADIVIAVIILLLIALPAVFFSLRNGGDRDQSDTETTASVAAEPTLADYAGKRIGVQTGTVFDKMVEEKIPGAQICYYNSFTDLLSALSAGLIDGFAGDEPVVKYMMLENGSVAYLHEYMDDYSFGFIFAKNDEGRALCEEFNSFVAKTKEDGTLKEIDGIWFGDDESKKVIPGLDTLSAEKGTLSLAVESVNPPFVYMKDSEIVGYEIDLAYRFCKENGYGLSLVDMNFGGIIPAVSSGKQDFGCSVVTITEERRESVEFSEPHYEGGAVLAVRAEDVAGTTAEAPKALSYKDYNGKIIGIRTGSSFEPIAFEKFPDSEYMYFDNISDLVSALSKKKIDAFLDDEPDARLINTERGDIDYLMEPIQADDYSFGFSKSPESDKLLSEFNAMLAELKESGELKRMNAKWFGTDESVKTVDTSGLTGENGSISVCVTPDNVPFAYISDNELTGYAVELMTEFAKRYGYSIRYEEGNVASCIAGLTSGKYDILAGTLSVTEERKQSMNFSDTVYNGGIMLVVRSADIEDHGGNVSSSTDPLSLNSPEYKVGVATGSAGMHAVEKYLPEAQMLVYDDIISAYEAVRLGKIDAYVYDRRQMEIAIKNGLTGVELTDKDLGEEINVAVGISRTPSVPDLANKLNEFIAKLKEDGTLDDMLKRWEGSNYEMPDIPVPESPEYKLKVGTTGIVEPYSFYKDNRLTGFDIELANRFGAYINAEIEYKVYNYSGIITAAGTNEIDCIFANLNVTDERKEKIDFSDPVYSIRNAMMVPERAESSGTGAGAAVKEKGSWIAVIKDSFEKNFIREDRYKLIIEGIGTTCLITGLSVVVGSLLAFLICMLRRVDSVLAGKICNIYVKLLQGTPMVVLLMILYYIIFGKSGIEAVWVAVIGFSLNFGAYASEIMRSGIESIEGGQREAALALGYTENRAFFKFIFPQAAVRFLPVYNGEVISLLKNTSIVGYIAIQDLTKMSDIIRSRTYEAFFPLIVTAIIYFIIAWIISLLLRFVLDRVDPRAKGKKKKAAAKAKTKAKEA